jgi:hypothetical protein
VRVTVLGLNLFLRGYEKNIFFPFIGDKTLIFESALSSQNMPQTAFIQSVIIME